jgi:hypothetical protein
VGHNGRSTNVEGEMNVIEFLEYLASYEQTHDLAVELSDAWAEHARSVAYEPAA